MKSMHRTLTALAVLAALALVASAPAAAASRDVDQTVKAARDGRVSVENIAGSIRVEGWDKGEVQVTGTLGDDVEDLQIKDEGSRTRIKVVYPKKKHSINEGADLVIKVPRGSSVEVECVSAPVSVDGVEGDLDLSSISGDVTAAGKCRSVEAETISGDLKVDCDAPKITVHSISGRVTAFGGKAAVEAQSVSGDIELEFDTFQELTVESVSGDADVEGALDPDGTFKFDLHGGDVSLTVPADVSADFRAETFSGDIVNDFGAKSDRTSKFTPGSSLEFETGGGGARVRINTFSGDVAIRKK